MKLAAVGFVFIAGTVLTSCMNRPAESITTEASKNEGSFDTTAVQVTVAPQDSLKIAIRNVISKYPGVKADVNDGEVILTGKIEGKRLQYLITEINTQMPKKVTNQLSVKK